MKCLNKQFKVHSFFGRFLSTSSKRREKDLSPGYKPKELESGTKYRIPGSFPNKCDGKTYSMLLPPPNVTGNLHLGHAINLTIQDVLARWHKLKGYDIMWVPGFDHAGIATQVAVEKQLLKTTGMTRHDIGKEKFMQLIWDWKNEKSLIIKNQLLSLGTLLNWQKEIFTLDSNMVEAVNEAFIRLFDDGLIYRDNALVNWCCYLQSAISDIEVEIKNISGPTLFDIPGYEKPIKFGVMTEFAYKFCDMDGEIIVGTTRPETIHGDVAIAVSPADSRYLHLKDAKVWHPFLDKSIPIIYDDLVDPDFGTGAMKVTPAHDLRDFQISKKHDLPIVQVIDENGDMNVNCGKFSRMKRYEARQSIIEELRILNLFRRNKEHAMSIPVCSRTGDVIELLLKPQWFLDCNDMAKLALKSVKNGRLVISPKVFEQNWFNWLENTRDWCISRQLWWGHRIPVYEYYSESNPEQKTFVAARNYSEALEKARTKINSSERDMKIQQDPDVLDTWFSSALFPFAIHGWPQQTQHLKTYYPLDVLETGHDILFFWVARMVMLGTKLTGELPFKKILLHGIICDSFGRKMSKSRGNTIEPEDIINGISTEMLQKRICEYNELGILSSEELKKSLSGQKKLFPNGIPECGIDALRFTLCSHNVKTHFINFDINECHTNKLFGNKIWQATKYTKLFIKFCRDNDKFENLNLTKTDLTMMDLWILSKLSKMTLDVNEALQNSDFHLAAAALKQFLYYEFCDIFIETTKPNLKNFSSKSVTNCYTLILCLNFALKNLSIFMPHICEELLNALPNTSSIYGIDTSTTFPSDEIGCYTNHSLEQNVENILNIVTSIRRIRTIHNIPRKQEAKVIIEMHTNEKSSFINSEIQVIKTLTNCNHITITAEMPIDNKSIFDTVSNLCCVHFIPINLEINASEGLSKKYNKLLKKVSKLQEIISKKGYREGTPKHVQDNHDNKLKGLMTELQKFKTAEINTSNKEFKTYIQDR